MTKQPNCTKSALTIEVWSLTFNAHSIADEVQSTLCYCDTIIDSSTCLFTLVIFLRRYAQDLQLFGVVGFRVIAITLLVKHEYKPSNVCGGRDNRQCCPTLGEPTC